jgi:hypothetical protein
LYDLKGFEEEVVAGFALEDGLCLEDIVILVEKDSRMDPEVWL